MTDLSKTIAPKSDQLNADDLIGRTMTVRITSMKLCAEPDQPIAAHFEGDNGKPYKPCKSMRRVMVNIWGSDGNAYVGRRMTLYRDDKVQFGGMAVGGIRISHMSDINEPVTMALTATRASRKPYTVKPLGASQAPPQAMPPSQDLIDGARSAATNGMAAYKAFFGGLNNAERLALTDAGHHETNKTVANRADDDAFSAPPSNGSTDPIATAFERGKQAHRNGQNARAMPAEYRDDKDLGDAWLEGLDVERMKGTGQ